MNELDKIALEIANEMACGPLPLKLLDEVDVIEFARRLVARLSEGQEPVAFVSEVYQSRYTIELNGYGLDIGTKLYLHPPLRLPAAEVLDAMKQAVKALGRAGNRIKGLSEGVFGKPDAAEYTITAADNLRAAIKRMEAAPDVQDDEPDRLLRQVFRLCEATEEIEPSNEFERGRVFEAKHLRNGIGNWFQDYFCGRSFMGELVLKRQAPAVPDGWLLLLNDLLTHLGDWERAYQLADRHDDCSKGYWLYQLKVIGRIKAMLAAAPQPAEKGGA